MRPERPPKTPLSRVPQIPFRRRRRRRCGHTRTLSSSFQPARGRGARSPSELRAASSLAPRESTARAFNVCGAGCQPQIYVPRRPRPPVGGHRVASDQKVTNPGGAELRKQFDQVVGEVPLGCAKYHACRASMIEALTRAEAPALFQKSRSIRSRSACDETIPPVHPEPGLFLRDTARVTRV
jgi:hypothetical protein